MSLAMKQYKTARPLDIPMLRPYAVTPELQALRFDLAVWEAGCIWYPIWFYEALTHQSEI
jgi:hypothetical protein